MKASDAIRTARALKKLKQHELAALIGVSQQMVSEWETEKETVAVKNWEALKQILDVDCAALEMPQTSVSNQTATVNAKQQSHSGSGNLSMFGQDGIACSGLDDQNPPPGVARDEWAELLYWLRRHPAMMRRVVEEARRIGVKMDDAANG